MQVENIAGKRLPARWPAQQQAQFPVGLGMAGQIVVHDQHIAPLSHEPFGDAGCGVRRERLQTRWIFAGGDYDHAVRQRPPLAQGGDDLRHRRTALADGAIDADDVLIGLIEDGVHRQGGLAGLAVSQNQFPLAAPNRDRRVHGLDPGR